jgi:antitoxin YqcF
MMSSSKNPLFDGDEILARIADAFGGDVETANVSVGSHPTVIVRRLDSPVKGVTSYSTFGLYEHPMIGPAGEFPVRIELVGACENDVESFPKILASAATCIRETPGVFYPGAIILNRIREFEPLASTQHFLLTTPFLWRERLGSLDLGTRKVSWLLAVPISESEYQYRRRQGEGSLEKLFEEIRLDIFTLTRSPVV